MEKASLMRIRSPVQRRLSGSGFISSPPLSSHANAHSPPHHSRDNHSNSSSISHNHGLNHHHSGNNSAASPFTWLHVDDSASYTAKAERDHRINGNSNYRSPPRMQLQDSPS